MEFKFFRKIVYRAIAILFLFIVVYGFIIPMTISSRSDYFSTLGGLLVFLFPICVMFYIIHFVIKNFTSKKEKNNGRKP
jgi:uncharacterized membrane protein